MCSRLSRRAEKVEDGEQAFRESQRKQYGRTLRRSQAACLARKYSSALFPSLAASVMLSKKTGERFTGADLPAQ